MLINYTFFKKISEKKNRLEKMFSCQVVESGASWLVCLNGVGSEWPTSIISISSHTWFISVRHCLMMMQATCILLSLFYLSFILT